MCPHQTLAHGEDMQTTNFQLLLSAWQKPLLIRQFLIPGLHQVTGRHVLWLHPYATIVSSNLICWSCWLNNPGTPICKPFHLTILYRPGSVECPWIPFKVPWPPGSNLVSGPSCHLSPENWSPSLPYIKPLWLFGRPLWAPWPLLVTFILHYRPLLSV